MRHIQNGVGKIECNYCMSGQVKRQVHQVDYFLVCSSQSKTRSKNYIFNAVYIFHTIHEPTGKFAVIIAKAIGIKGNKDWM